MPLPPAPVRAYSGRTGVVMVRFSIATVATAALAAALVLAGCSPTPPDAGPSVSAPTDVAPSPTGDAEEPSPTEEPTPTDEPAPTGPLDARRAVDAALQAVPGVVVELGTDSERGRAVWEVGVLRDDGTGVELYIDQENGEVVREGVLRLDTEQRTAPLLSAPEAIDVALAAVPGAVDELDLGTERSTVVWEVMVAADAGGRYELYIDAASGEILKQERDD